MLQHDEICSVMSVLCSYSSARKNVKKTFHFIFRLTTFRRKNVYFPCLLTLVLCLPAVRTPAKLIIAVLHSHALSGLHLHYFEIMQLRTISPKIPDYATDNKSFVISGVVRNFWRDGA